MISSLEVARCCCNTLTHSGLCCLGGSSAVLSRELHRSTASVLRPPFHHRKNLLWHEKTTAGRFSQGEFFSQRGAQCAAKLGNVNRHNNRDSGNFNTGLVCVLSFFLKFLLMMYLFQKVKLCFLPNQAQNSANPVKLTKCLIYHENELLCFPAFITPGPLSQVSHFRGRKKTKNTSWDKN